VEPVGDAHAGYRDGRLKFRLHGKKLNGGWTLRTRPRRRASGAVAPHQGARRRGAAGVRVQRVDAAPASVLRHDDRDEADVPKEAAADGVKRTARSGAAKKALPTNARSARRLLGGAETPARSTRTGTG
jgi:bifunctional non-homologous end joining protein LigD